MDHFFQIDRWYSYLTRQAFAMTSAITRPFAVTLNRLRYCMWDLFSLYPFDVVSIWTAKFKKASTD